MKPSMYLPPQDEVQRTIELYCRYDLATSSPVPDTFYIRDVDGKMGLFEQYSSSDTNRQLEAD